jgi:hypothetical protein
LRDRENHSGYEGRRLAAAFLQRRFVKKTILILVKYEKKNTTVCSGIIDNACGCHK